jgi:hypothetical protein
VRAAGRTGQTILTPARQAAIRAAIDAYGLDTTTDAVRGITRSPHHMGDNTNHTRYDDLEYALKDAKSIERFADDYRTKPPIFPEQLSRQEAKACIDHDELPRDPKLAAIVNEYRDYLDRKSSP